MYHPSIGQPRVLLVVSHPSVGGGIETLLRLERRYEVRRASKLAEGSRLARGWPADVVIVDAAMLPGDGRVVLGAPVLVLAGSEAEGSSAVPRLDDPRGWVPKDVASTELVAAVERLLTRPPEDVAGPIALFAVGSLLVILVALLLYLLWIAVV